MKGNLKQIHISKLKLKKGNKNERNMIMIKRIDIKQLQSHRRDWGNPEGALLYRLRRSIWVQKIMMWKNYSKKVALPLPAAIPN